MTSITRLSIPSDGGTIVVSYDGVDVYDDGYRREERRRYTYTITANGWEYTGNDLHSGVGAAVDSDAALATLLSFLGAAAEAYSYWIRTGDESENFDLFPPHVTEWAYQWEDEISLIAYDLDGEYESEYRS